MDTPPPPSRLSLDRRAFLAAASIAAETLATPALAQRDAPSKEGKRLRSRPSDASPAVSRTVAEHVVGARFADLDAATVDAAKQRLLDLAGCAIGGKRGESVPQLLELVRLGGGREEATLLGTDLRVPAREAAMANAIVARSFDFEVMTVLVEDVEVASHHAPTTVMTALAMAEREKADGRSFLTALAIGDDLAARTLAAAGLDFNDGWDGVPLHATLGATAIAARLAGLDARTVRHAMGLATDQIGGTVQSIWDGASAWKIQQGTPARNGIFAAELAKAGWTGMADPLLAPFGLYGQFTPGAARPELLTRGLGRAFYAEGYFKPYPSCAANHPTIECALSLRANNRIDPADLASIRLVLPARTLNVFVAKPYLPGPSPHSQANFNLRFAAATALLYGSLRQEHYDPAALASPALAAMIDRIALVPAPPDAHGVTIEATLRDGRVVRETLAGQPRRYPRVQGSTYAEIVAKFRQQVDFAGDVPAGVADMLVRRIAAIDEERDMHDFARLLSRAVRRAA